jgi:hypothetical protein
VDDHGSKTGPGLLRVWLVFLLVSLGLVTLSLHCARPQHYFDFDTWAFLAEYKLGTQFHYYSKLHPLKYRVEYDLGAWLGKFGIAPDLTRRCVCAAGLVLMWAVMLFMRQSLFGSRLLVVPCLSILVFSCTSCAEFLADSWNDHMISLPAYVAGIALVLTFWESPVHRAWQCILVFAIHSSMHILEGWFWAVGLLLVLGAQEMPRKAALTVLAVCGTITTSLVIWGLNHGTKLGSFIAKDASISLKGLYYGCLQASWNTAGFVPMPGWLALAWMAATMAIPILCWAQFRDRRSAVWIVLLGAATLLPLTYETHNPERFYPFMVCSVLIMGDLARRLLEGAATLADGWRSILRSRTHVLCGCWLLMAECLALRGLYVNWQRSGEEHAYGQHSEEFHRSLSPNGLLAISPDAFFYTWTAYNYKGRVHWITDLDRVQVLKSANPDIPVYLVSGAYKLLPQEAAARTVLKFAVPGDENAKVYELYNLGTAPTGAPPH